MERRRFSSRGRVILGAGLLSLIAVAGVWAAEEWKSGIAWPEPVVVTPGKGTAPPSDAIVLFDGKNLDAWNGGEGWTFKDGYGISGSRITTKQSFGDCQLHLEFASPEEIQGDGQARGNNGVFFMDHYELQVLDSYKNVTYFDGQCGSIYKQHPPLVNASLPPGEWQTYDIIFMAPRFNADGSVKSPAALTVLQNGILVQNHFELLGATSFIQAPVYTPHANRLPLTLYYHKDPVRFRNIWIRDLMPKDEK